MNEDRRERVNEAADAIEKSLIAAVKAGLEDYSSLWHDVAEENEPMSVAGLALSHAIVHYAKEVFPGNLAAQTIFAGGVSDHMLAHLQEAARLSFADGLDDIIANLPDEGNGVAH